ncbi:hypothetical protein KCP77_09575 [Salmonella enterica subsp. enterica]|nr:hypothetical protein KCP77_09575 [Salmonella enterica subsp. enterica]
MLQIGAAETRKYSCDEDLLFIGQSAWMAVVVMPHEFMVTKTYFDFSGAVEE